MIKRFIKILCVVIFINFLCAQEILSTYDDLSVKVAVPKNCKAIKQNGDMQITCKNDTITLQILPIEIGCYENAKIIADLLGDDPRDLKAYDLNGTKIDTKKPFKEGILTFTCMPCNLKHSIPLIVVCKNELSVGIFGENKNLLQEIANSLEF